MTVRSVDRRVEDPHHPYWSLVDTYADYWVRTEGHGGDTGFEQETEADRARRFPEVAQAQWEYDVEQTILRSLP